MIKMFVYTVTKKRAVRTFLLILALIAGIIIGIAAIMTAVSTGAEERRLPIYSVERADNKIALTFNCAWGNSNTGELLQILEKENVKATFFVTGEFCDKFPEDVLKIFQAGHEVQNHSNKHPHIEGANINDFINDTREAEKKIRAITGVTPTLYRAPYGEFDNNSVFTINGMGYKYIQWSVDSVDWESPSPKTIIKRVTGGTKSGSILLFHNDLENTTTALPEVISKLKEKGFDFLPVSELVYHDNYRIDSTGKQFPSAENGIASIHVPGSEINSAFEALLANLTIDELISLENGLSDELIAKLSNVLSKEEIAAVAALSKEELQATWGMLVEAKATALAPKSTDYERVQTQPPVGGSGMGNATSIPDIKGGGGFDFAGIGAGINSPNSSITMPTVPTMPPMTSADMPEISEPFTSESAPMETMEEMPSETLPEIPEDPIMSQTNGVISKD